MASGYDSSCENGNTLTPENYSAVRKSLPEVSYIDLEGQCIPCDTSEQGHERGEENGRRQSILTSSLLKQALTLFSGDSDSDDEERIRNKEPRKEKKFGARSNETQARTDFNKSTDTVNGKAISRLNLRKISKKFKFRRESIISTATVSSEFEFSGEVNPHFGLHPLRDPMLCLVQKLRSRKDTDISYSLDCSSLALTCNGDLLVADAGTNRVQSFNIHTGGTNQQKIKQDQEILPWCVTVLPSDEIVMVCFSSKQNTSLNGKDFSVQIYGADGKFLQSIRERNPSCAMGNADNSFTIYDDDTQSLMTYARPDSSVGPFALATNLPLIGDIGLIMHIAGDVRGNCYGSDWIKQCVSVFSPGGIHTHMIGLGYLVNPRGLCIDPHGRMFVVEMGSDKLYCTRPDYTLVALDLPGGLKQPTDCVVDQDCNLYVLDAQGDVTVYKYS